MRRPTRLSDYPWVIIRLDCVLCDRKGCYRLARLAARYGPEQSLDALLADLANDCPWWRSNPRKYEPRCGARFFDLERNLPPDDRHAPVFRQRQPDRDSLRKDRSRATTGNGFGALPMLSGYAHDSLTIACRRCPRRETYLVKDLLTTCGDAALGLLLKTLTADCSRAAETQVYELCQAHFDMPT